MKFLYLSPASSPLLLRNDIEGSANMMQWRLVTHVCVRVVVRASECCCRSRQWLVAFSGPSHYLNQCRYFWSHRDNLQWHLMYNTIIVVHETHLKMLSACNTAAILSRPLCGNSARRRWAGVPEVEWKPSVNFSNHHNRLRTVPTQTITSFTSTGNC